MDSHPVPSKALLFKAISNNPRFDVEVCYCINPEKRKEEYQGGDSNIMVTEWGVPLLEGLNVHYLKNFSPRPRNSFFGLINPGIVRILFKNEYDAVMIHGYNTITALLAFLGGILSGTPIVLRGEADTLEKQSFFKKSLKRIFIQPLLKTASAVFYSFDLNKKHYEKLGVPERKLFFFPCAVDVDALKSALADPEKERNALRRELGIEPGDMAIGFVGKLIDRKRPFDLLRAHEIITKENNSGRDVHLLLIGDGKLMSGMEKRVREEKIRNVHFLGFKNQSELPHYYNAMDLFVLSSEKDPSPKVLNEALGFGLPVILTNGIGTAPDMIVGEKAGFMVDVGKPERIAEMVRKIIDDDGLRRKLKENALKASSKWSYENDIKGLLSALDFVYGDKKDNS